MLKKLSKIIVLSTMLFGFSANAYESTSGISVDMGVGKIFKDHHSKDITFHFGEDDVTIKKFEPKDSYLLFAGMNYNFCNGFSVGGELSYEDHSQIEKNHSKSESLEAKLKNEAITFLATAKYRFDTGASFSPFIGGGVGASKMKFNFHSKDHDFSNLKRTELAYLGTAGVSFDASKDARFSIAYAMRGTHDIESGHAHDKQHKDAKGKHSYCLDGKELTSFTHFKNQTQSIEASIEFKL